nr:hypothetical protein LTR18_002322 [Exophiala xenobiotica]
MAELEQRHKVELSALQQLANAGEQEQTRSAIRQKVTQLEKDNAEKSSSLQREKLELQNANTVSES